MPRVTIEPEEVQRGKCADCGGPTGTAIGYTYEDGNANSVYYLGWCEGEHHDRSAFLTVASGEWGEGTTGKDRATLGVEVRPAGMRLADHAAFERPDFLGSFVARDVAMELGDLDAFWHLVDHIVVDDPAAARVMEWIQGDRATALTE